MDRPGTNVVLDEFFPGEAPPSKGAAPPQHARAPGPYARVVTQGLADMTRGEAVATISFHEARFDAAAMEDASFGLRLGLPFPLSVKTRAYRGPRCELFGVIDGRGGRDVAEFVRSGFPEAFCAALAASDEGGGAGMPFLAEARAAGLPDGVRAAMFSAVLQLEQNLRSVATDDLRAKAWAQGASACFVFIGPQGAAPRAAEGPGGRPAQRLRVANVGDVAAVLGRNNGALGASLTAVPLTTKHSAADAAEAAAIRARGGFVLADAEGVPRAQGVLGTSRCIGLTQVKPCVSAVPSVAAVDVGPSDEFLIVASRGLWQHLTHQEAVNVVAHYRATAARRDCKDAAEALVGTARMKTGAARVDNTSALVLFFA